MLNPDRCTEICDITVFHQSAAHKKSTEKNSIDKMISSVITNTVLKKISITNSKKLFKKIDFQGLKDYQFSFSFLLNEPKVNWSQSWFSSVTGLFFQGS